MSYIQVEIGGKLRGLKFNQLALEEFSKKLPNTGVDIPSTMLVYAEVWGGLTGCSYVKSEEIDYTFEDVCDWVDELFATDQSEVIQKIDDTLSSTQVYKRLLENSARLRSGNTDGADKKKVKKT